MKLLRGRREEPGNEAMCTSYPSVLRGTGGTVLWNPSVFIPVQLACTVVGFHRTVLICPKYM